MLMDLGAKASKHWNSADDHIRTGRNYDRCPDATFSRASACKLAVLYDSLKALASGRRVLVD